MTGTGGAPSSKPCVAARPECVDVRRPEKKPLAFGADATRRMKREAEEPTDLDLGGESVLPVRLAAGLPVLVILELVLGVGGSVKEYWEELAVSARPVDTPRLLCCWLLELDTLDLDVDGGPSRTVVDELAATCPGARE